MLSRGRLEVRRARILISTLTEHNITANGDGDLLVANPNHRVVGADGNVDEEGEKENRESGVELDELPV